MMNSIILFCSSFLFPSIPSDSNVDDQHDKHIGWRTVRDVFKKRSSTVFTFCKTIITLQTRESITTIRWPLKVFQFSNNFSNMFKPIFTTFLWLLTVHKFRIGQSEGVSTVILRHRVTDVTWPRHHIFSRSLGRIWVRQLEYLGNRTMRRHIKVVCFRHGHLNPARFSHNRKHGSTKRVWYTAEA